jgi:hypothetical protein
MKIELSPWAVSDTSLQLPRKRSRTRSKEDSAVSSAATGKWEALPVVATFSNEAANERIPKPGKWEPVLLLTFQNEVRVLGRTMYNGEAVIQESERMNQVARHSTTFLSSDEDSFLPWIPCLYQAGRFFALQEGNRRLVSWTVDQTVEEGYTATLPSPCLSLTNDSNHVLGSCQDGSFFVVKPSSELTLVIEFHYPGIPANAVHVATLFDPSQSRRQATEAKARSIVQIYADSRCLLIFRHILTSSGIASKCVQCDLESSARDVQFVGLHKENVVMRYSAESRCRCCSVSISEAAVTTRITLPPCFNDSRRSAFGLVGSLMVLAPPDTTNGSSVKQLVVCDLYRESVASTISFDIEYDQILSLHTDGDNRVALVAARKEKVCVAFATFRWTQEAANISCPSTLANGLLDRVGTSPVRRGGSSSSLLHSEIIDSVSQAVDLLHEAFRELCSMTPMSRNTFFVAEAYERAISLVSGIRGNSKHAATDAESANNPQEPFEQHFPMNGKKRKALSQTPSPTRTTAMNGVRLTTSPEIVLEPKMLPEAFVRSACQVTVEILLLSHLSEETRNEARVLLRRFVRSGKVSARLVLKQISDLLLSLEGRSSKGKTAYSPVDFIFDLFRCCNDVSEHQAVVSIKYLIAYATARDVYSQLRRDKVHRQLVEAQMSIVLDGNEGRIQNEQHRRLPTLESINMVLLVVFSCLRMIASYSDFNEILLKNAIQTLLSPGEVFLLDRLLSKLLSAKMLGTTAEYRVIIQWLAVVNEQPCLLPHPSNLMDASHVQKTTRLHVRTAEGLISLKQLVASSVDGAQRRLTGASTTTIQKKQSHGTQSYQIERLVL